MTLHETGWDHLVSELRPAETLRDVQVPAGKPYVQGGLPAGGPARLTSISTTEEIVEEARQGRMFILVDDEDRENEGDLIIPACAIDPAAVNFMAVYGRGLICLSLDAEIADHLELPLMPVRNSGSFDTAFTVSIEAVSGVTTGISAADRARTIAAAVHPAARPADLATPGHVFPLRARAGGVLARQGHTEASVDICGLAGRRRAAVICEIIKDDGDMARVPDLLQFAARHNLKIGTIKDLVQHLRHRRQTS